MPLKLARRKLARRKGAIPYLTLFIVVAVGALVITMLQISPGAGTAAGRSGHSTSASGIRLRDAADDTTVFQEWDEVLSDPNGASVEQFQPSAAFETGSTTLCQFSDTVGMFGDAADVAELVTDLDNAASAEGLAPPTGSDTQPDPSDVNEYQTFSDTVDLSQIPGATASDCSISYLNSQASTVAYYKGGTALERRNPQVMLDSFSIPNWLLQVLAGVAGFAVTIAISTAFTLAFTAALGPLGVAARTRRTSFTGS